MSARHLILPLMLSAASGAAFAADRTDDGRLKEAFGSTIISTYPDGRQAELWILEDGTYKAEGRRHEFSDGAWQIKGEKVCLKQRHPFPAPFSFCTPVPATLDKPWTGKAYTGEAINIRLVKGRDEDRTRKAGKDDAVQAPG